MGFRQFFFLLLYLNYSCREFRGPAEEAEHHLNFRVQGDQFNDIFPAFLWRALTQASFLPSNPAETHNMLQDAKDDQGASQKSG